MQNGQPNELSELIAEPSLPIANGDMAEMTRIFYGRYLEISTAGNNVIFEFEDDDGFVNGFSIPEDCTQDEFVAQMKDFIGYVG